MCINIIIVTNILTQISILINKYNILILKVINKGEVLMNKELKKAASFNPTNKTHQMPIFEICKEVESKEIILPLYQRDVCWTLEKNVSLLNYQLLGNAPVSPISMNEIKILAVAVDQVSFIDREKIVGDLRNKLSVSDGQQRITCNYKAYINHKDFKNIVLDINKGKFKILEEDIQECQVPVGILLNKNDDCIFEYCKNKGFLSNEDVKNLLLQIRIKFKSYNYTINKAEDLTEKDQIEWFEVLNNAGSRVTRIQMDIAKQRSKNIDIYKEYVEVFTDKINYFTKNAFKMKATEVSYPMAMLNPTYEVILNKKHSNNYAPIASDYKFGLMDEFKSKTEILELIYVTLKNVDKAIEFIKIEKLEIPNRIDYITYLTGYFIFLGNNELTGDKINALVDWYKQVDFTNQSNTARRQTFSDLLKI